MYTDLELLEVPEPPKRCLKKDASKFYSVAGASLIGGLTTLGHRTRTIFAEPIGDDASSDDILNPHYP